MSGVLQWILKCCNLYINGKLGTVMFIINLRQTNQMNRRPVFYSSKPQRKNVADLSPRLGVKKQQTTNNVVHGKASAQMKRRKLDTKAHRIESPAYSRPKAQLKKINEQKQLLSEQQIRNSALYKMLQQQIKELARRQQEQVEKLRKVREQRRKEAETIRKEQFASKLQIWELKNELIQEQKSQTERLIEQIRPVEEGNPEDRHTDAFDQAEPQLTENQESSDAQQEL